METEIKTKKCSKCGRELPVEEFHKNKSSKDGLYCYCKECSGEIGKITREKKRIAAKCSNSVIPKNFFRQSTGGGNECNPLSKFTPRDLMEELARRGYKGKLSYVYEINIENF